MTRSITRSQGFAAKEFLVSDTTCQILEERSEKDSQDLEKKKESKAHETQLHATHVSEGSPERCWTGLGLGPDTSSQEGQPTARESEESRGLEQRDEKLRRNYQINRWWIEGEACNGP
jgi:hypothetical protein